MSNAIPILPRIKQQACACSTISPRSAGLLVEAFKALWYTPVHHEAHILLIDAHSECCCCDYDVPAWFIGYPFFLALDALVGGEAGVVGCSAYVMGAEAGSESVAVGAEGDVDDA